jgi:tryptophan synthase beta chain
VVLINMSGRGDKDIFTIADALDDAHWKTFIKQKADQYHRESSGSNKSATNDES